MSRLKKGSAAAKAWGRRMQALRGPHRLSRSGPKRARHHSGGKISMARRRIRHWYSRRRRGKSGFSIQRTAFTLIRTGALVAPGINEFQTSSGPTERRIARALAAYGGYNLDGNNFDGALLTRMWLPFLGASLATYGIPKIAGMIRRLH